VSFKVDRGELGESSKNRFWPIKFSGLGCSIFWFGMTSPPTTSNFRYCTVVLLIFLLPSTAKGTALIVAYFTVKVRIFQFLHGRHFVVFITVLDGTLLSPFVRRCCRVELVPFVSVDTTRHDTTSGYHCVWSSLHLLSCLTIPTPL
jgi:hypothetical protein